MMPSRMLSDTSTRGIPVLNCIHHRAAIIPLPDEESARRGGELYLDVVVHPEALPEGFGYGDLTSLGISAKVTS